MMYKKFISLFLTILIVISNVNISFANDENKTLIIYECEKSFSFNENKINHLNELLYRFSNNVSKISIDEYNQGYINEFDYVFIDNIQNNISNKYLIDDLLNYRGSIYWIGNQIESLLNNNDIYNLDYENKNNNIQVIKYKGNEFRLNNNNYFNIIKAKDNVDVIATMSDGYNEYPYIIKDKNLYYISDYSINDLYIFEDTLNDFYNVRSFNDEKIFVKIDDVHLFRDNAKLKEIANYLYIENVPFMINLIPAYFDSQNRKLNTLYDDKEFIETIKYMQQKGGSVVLHGYSNSLEFSDEGYEFWDIKLDKPIEKDLDIYIKNRVLSGLRLCIENDIYPLAFESPNYAMNIDGYKEIKKYFSTYIGRYQNNNEKFVISTFPYIIKDSNSFNVLIPENLGAIEADNNLSVDIIKENFDKLSIVRGYSGGFLFNPDIDIKYLQETIEYLKEKEVKFLDLKMLNNYIKVDDISIVSNNGKIDVSYDKDKTLNKSEEYTTFDKNIKNLNENIIILIKIVLIIFIFVFILFRILNKNKFKRG